MRSAKLHHWLFVLAAVAACSSAAGSHIRADDLLVAMQTPNPPIIIDVRTQGEYDRGHVPGARHISFYSVWARAGEIETPLDTPVVVYCEHGPRAGMAKAGLKLAGFTQVRYLEGHMSGWRARGLPMETGAP